MKERFRNMSKNVVSRLKLSLQRFPEAIVMSTLLVVLGILANHEIFDDEILGRIALAVNLGLVLMIITKLLYERFGFKLLWLWIGEGIAVLVLVGFYFLLPEEDLKDPFYIKYWTLIVALYLVMSLIHYFYRREKYSLYCIKLATNFFTTYLYTLVLCGGLMGIVFAVNSLFNLDISDRIYFDMFLVSVGIFGVIYFLGNILKYQEEALTKDYPKVIKILFTGIVMPLLIVYTVIIYAYFIKILINWALPEGVLGHLVLWYGFAAVVTLFVVHELMDENRFVKLFSRIFPFTFIIPIIMMLVAVFVRINAYGFTLLRYYIILFAIWYLFVGIYFIIRQKRHMTYVIVVLTGLVLVSAFGGPLNGLAVTFRSQNHELKTILVENNMLEGERIVPNKDVSEEDMERISDILSYFRRMQAMERIAYVPEEFEINDMVEVFGFKHTYNYRSDNKHFSYDYYENVSGMKIDTNDYLIDFRMYNHKNEEERIDGLRCIINGEKDYIKLFIDNEKVMEIDMNKAIIPIHENVKEYKVESQEEMTVIEENDRIKVTIIFSNLHGEENGDQLELNSAEGYLLIDVKP